MGTGRALAMAHGQGRGVEEEMSRASRIKKGQNHDQNIREEAWWWYKFIISIIFTLNHLLTCDAGGLGRSRMPGWLGKDR